MQAYMENVFFFYKTIFKKKNQIRLLTKNEGTNVKRSRKNGENSSDLQNKSHC